MLAAVMTQKEKDDDMDRRLLAGLRELERTSHSDQARDLFYLQNEAGWPNETGHTCGGCVQRVVARVREHLRTKGLL
jgi:hypothetical protein